MALSELISPPYLAFSRNQIPLRLNVPDLYTEAGAYEEIDFQLNPPDTDDDTMQLTWSYNGVDFDITFTFVASPDPEVYEIEKYTGSELSDYIDWISDVLVPGLMSHPEVNIHFQIEFFTNLSDYGIKMRAAFQGDYNLSLIPTGYSSSVVNSTDGALPELNENFKVFVRVYFQSDLDDTLAQYNRGPFLNFYPNNDGHVDLDLQPYIHEYFRASELPTYPAPKAFIRCTKILRDIYAEYGVQYGSPVQRKNISRTAKVRVLQGGVATHDFPAVRDDIPAYFKNDLQPLFLTNRKIRTLYPGQPDFLHFYMSVKITELTTVQLGIQTFTPGGDATTFINLTDYDALEGANVYRFPIDVDALTPSIPANAISYKLWVKRSDNNWTSEKITVHRREKPIGLTVLEYQNALGVVETIALPWNRQRVTDISKGYYERRLGLNYAASDAQRIPFNEIMMDRFDLAINQNNEPDRAWLPELMMSPEVSLLIGFERIPVTLSAGKLNQELQNEAGHFFANPKISVQLEKQIAFSRIINLSELCE